MAVVLTEPPVITFQPPVRMPISGPLPPSGTMPPELRRMFPAPLVQAIEGLWQQMQDETLMPLYFVERTALAEQFQAVYPRFVTYYISAIFAMLPNLQDPDSATAIAGAGFDALREELRHHGRIRLGDAATVGALIGLDAVTRAFKAGVREMVAPPERRAALQPSAGEGVDMSIAYMFTIFAVSFALIQGPRFAGRWDNVAQLAWWSRGYALQIYDLAKRQGLLRPPTAPGPLPDRSTDEDIALAEAGLEQWKDLLDRDERR